MTPEGCIDGTLVIELADGWGAGSVAIRLLSKLGARVLKLGPPEGDRLRLIGPRAAERTTDDAENDCRANGIPAGRVQGMEEIAENAHTWARDMQLELEHLTIGPLKLLRPPFKSKRSPGVVESTAPNTGQHTQDVLSELLGFEKEMLDAISKNGVIGGPEL